MYFFLSWYIAVHGHEAIFEVNAIQAWKTYNNWRACQCSCCDKIVILQIDRGVCLIHPGVSTVNFNSLFSDGWQIAIFYRCILEPSWRRKKQSIFHYVVYVNTKTTTKTKYQTPHGETSFSSSSSPSNLKLSIKTVETKTKFLWEVKEES